MVNIVQPYKVSCSTNVCGILTVNNVEKYIIIPNVVLMLFCWCCVTVLIL